MSARLSKPLNPLPQGSNPGAAGAKAGAGGARAGALSRVSPTPAPSASHAPKLVKCRAAALLQGRLGGTTHPPPPAPASSAPGGAPPGPGPSPPSLPGPGSTAQHGYAEQPAGQGRLDPDPVPDVAWEGGGPAATAAAAVQLLPGHRVPKPKPSWAIGSKYHYLMRPDDNDDAQLDDDGDETGGVVGVESRTAGQAVVLGLDGLPQHMLPGAEVEGQTVREEVKGFGDSKVRA